MPEHRETRQVACPARLMFDVVADVEKYPEFLPWVVALRILSRESENVVIAEMAVGYGALRERYTSRVTLNPEAMTVDVVEIKGPFKQLENHWRFTPRADGHAEVEFSIAFEFASRLLSAAADKAFGAVVLKMADAFEARALALYQRAD